MSILVNKGNTMTILKPGILVSLKTQLIGTNEDDLGAAIRARANAAAIIRAVCANTGFGLICPTSREEELSTAVSKAGLIVDEFNSNSETIKVRVCVLPSDLRSNDPLTVEAIVNETISLLRAMVTAIEEREPGRIREAVAKAKPLVGMFDDHHSRALHDAVESARRIARQIVRGDEFGTSGLAQIVHAVEVFTGTEIPLSIQHSEQAREERREAPTEPPQAIDTAPTGVMFWDGPCLPGVNPEKFEEFINQH